MRPPSRFVCPIYILLQGVIGCSCRAIFIANFIHITHISTQGAGTRLNLTLLFNPEKITYASIMRHVSVLISEHVLTTN
jgi:hypothetical protein